MKRASSAARTVRNARHASFVLQERDLAMLHSLAEGHLLTAESLEWLHVATWRTRYRRCAEQVSDAGAWPYKLHSNLYRRLRGLCDRQYIRRITRAVDQARGDYYRLPDAYMLTRRGADLLAERWGIEPESIGAQPHRSRAIQNLDHAIAIGRLYAALRAELEYRGRQLAQWQGDHLLSRSAYDRIPVVGVREPLPILPDATFVLDTVRYFVEIDRGTRPLRSWADKIRAYEAYQRSVWLATRYQTDQFRVLIVTPTPTRLARIAEEIARITRQASAGYLLLHTDHVHPTTIRRGWQCIGSVDWTPRRIVDRLIETPTMTLSPHPLWEHER
jgi:hypothetical protein